MPGKRLSKTVLRKTTVRLLFFSVLAFFGVFVSENHYPDFGVSRLSLNDENY